MKECFYKLKKQKMRVMFVVVFALIMAQTIHAQISPQNVQELMSYYDDNAQSLDPIEGVYDVNIEQWGENAYVKFPSETTNVTMLIYKDLDGSFRAFQNSQVCIKRVGMTHIYNYSIFWAGSNVTDTKRFVLKENTFFNVDYSIPDKQLRYDLKRNYQAGDKVNFKSSFIKTYPVQDVSYLDGSGNTGNSVGTSLPSSVRIIENPSVSRTTAELAKIKSVKLAKDYTAIEITYNNQSRYVYGQWCNINRNTYIVVNGVQYTLTRADGIQIAPEKTYFSYERQSITFTLYFPPIPNEATSIDLVESVDRGWKFYGIKILLP